MKKNLLSLLCLLAFTLPGWAEEASIAVLPSDFGSGKTYLNTETSATIGGVEFAVKYINPQSGQIKKGEFYLYNKTALPGDITKVVINEKSGTFTPSTTYLNLGDETISGKKTTGDITGTEATAADGSKSVTLTATGNHKYFNLSGNIVTGTSYATSIVIYYNDGTSSTPTTCAAPVFNIENNSQVTVGTVVKATCNTPNSTVTISGPGLASEIVGEENAGYAEFEVTENDLNKILVLTASAAIVDGNGEIIKSDNTTVQFEVIEAPNTISDELTTNSLGISGSAYTLYKYTAENTGVSYSAKAGFDQQAIHINTTTNKNGKNSGLTSVDNPKGLVIESIVVTVNGGTPIMNMSNTPGVVEGTSESTAAEISVTAPADAETITGTQSGSDMIYKPTKEFKYFTLTSNGNSHFSKVLVNYFKPEVPEVVVPEAIVVTPALSETNEITVTEGNTVTFSSNNAAQLSVSINAEAATLEANPYVLTVTEDCTVEIIPVDSTGKLYENLKLEAYVYVDATVDPSTKAKSTYSFDFTKSDSISEGSYSDPEDMLTIISDGAGIFGGMLIEGNGDDTRFEYAENQGWKFCTNVSEGSTYHIDLYNNSETEYNITSIKFNFADNKIVDLVNQIEDNATVANNEWTGNSTSATLRFTTNEELVLNSIDITFEHEPVKQPELNKTQGQDNWFLTHEDADHTIFFKITNAQGEDVTADRMVSGTTPDVPARSIKIDVDHEGYTAYAEGSEFTIYEGDILSAYAQHPHGMVSEIDSRSYEDIMTGVESICTDAEGEAIYFNMQGVQVDEPAEGIYIRVANGKATKIAK